MKIGIDRVGRSLVFVCAVGFRKKLKIHVIENGYASVSSFIREALVEKMDRDNNK